VLKFATIDHQVGSAVAAVWLTYRTGLEVSHGNAVVIDVEADTSARTKIRSLTRDAIVLSTDGTSLDDFPIDGTPLTVSDLGELVAETERAQFDIIEAIKEYKRRTRSASLVEPAFAAGPVFDPRSYDEAEVPVRALATADYVKRAWSAWLRTDEERRRRTTHPRSGETPWMMPDALNSPTIPDFPDAFRARLVVQSNT